MAISSKAKHELSWIILFLLCLVYSLFITLGNGGYLSLRETRKQLLQLQEENQRLEGEQRELIETIEGLKTNPYEVERLARERFNMARSGDIIVNVN